MAKTAAAQGSGNIIGVVRAADTRDWAMSVHSDNKALNGANLLKPGKTPHQSIRFLAFLAAVLKAVHDYDGVFRAGIATKKVLACATMTERRFNEDEVAAIFQQATEPQQTGQRPVHSGQGMTLAEIQDIGRQVGIAPELVVQAAASLGQVNTQATRRFIGLPIGVTRTVDLDRKLSDDEWERLVVDLRETFDARGVVRQEGSFRQWTNGNLQVHLEPTENGQRIRFRTLSANARAWMMGGLGMLGIAAATTIAAAVGGGNHANLTSVTELGVIGAGLFAVGAIRLPGWARRRRQQMEEISGRLNEKQMPPER